MPVLIRGIYGSGVHFEALTVSVSFSEHNGECGYPPFDSTTVRLDIIESTRCRVSRAVVDE